MEQQEKQDRRKETSKANMEKARLKILEERRLAKLNQYEVSDDTESSDEESSDEEPVIYINKPKKGGSKPQMIPKKKDKNENELLKNQLNDLNKMVQLLAMNQKKQQAKAKPKTKKIIQIVPPVQQAPQNNNNNLETMMKHKILKF